MGTFQTRRKTVDQSPFPFITDAKRTYKYVETDSKYRKA